MKIAHLHVAGPPSGGRVAALTRRIERLRGVVGVVAVRSIGLLTVLYDERRVDPVAISDVAVHVAEPSFEEGDCDGDAPLPARAVTAGGRVCGHSAARLSASRMGPARC